MDADIVEIPPPIHLLKKQKRAILHDVIYIDDDDDSEDLVIIGEKVGKSNKGKTIEAIHQVVEVSASFGSKNHGLAGNPEARKVLHAGNPPADTKFKSAKKAFGSSSSCHSNFKHEILRKFRSFKQFDTVNDASDHHFIHRNSSMKQRPKNWAKEIQKEWKILEEHLSDSIFVRVYESRMDLLRAVIIGAEGTPYHDALFFFDVYFPRDYPNVPPSVHFHTRGFVLNPNLRSSGEICISLLNTWHGSETECWLPHVSTILQVLVSIQGLILNTKPFFNGPRRECMMDLAKAESMSLEYNKYAFIQSLAIMIHMIRRPPKNFEDFVVGHFISRAHDILVACNAYMEGAQVGCLVKGGVQDVDEGDKSCTRWFKNHLAKRVKVLVIEFGRIEADDCKKAFGSSSSCHSNFKHEILWKFRSFKQFDTVIDASDHHFFYRNFFMKQRPKNWFQEIQKEWKILEKHLPDSIFVRVYESRMDLLRAVIIGAEGTPYHDALFFFDVYFPTGYPIVPPLVHFHSQGFWLNPNLQGCGKVCLSLLNTWHGSKTERWLPHVSTILQVLVSIQGLLNTKPFFNEPGRCLTDLANTESISLNNNRHAFIHSLGTMIRMIRRPPKNFEDFVVGHFISRAHDILVACNAYMEGAKVGCLVKGGVQDVGEGDKSCTRWFKDNIAERMKVLVREFGRIGAKDCKKFLYGATKANKRSHEKTKEELEDEVEDDPAPVFEEPEKEDLEDIDIDIDFDFDDSEVEVEGYASLSDKENNDYIEEGEENE